MFWPMGLIASLQGLVVAAVSAKARREGLGGMSCDLKFAHHTPDSKSRLVNGRRIFFWTFLLVLFWKSFPVTWQAVRQFRTQVRDLINSGSETVGLGEKI